MVSYRAAVKLGPADSWDASEEQAEKRRDYSISLEKKTPLRRGTGFWAPLTNIQVAQGELSITKNETLTQGKRDEREERGICNRNVLRMAQRDGSAGGAGASSPHP